MSFTEVLLITEASVLQIIICVLHFLSFEEEVERTDPDLANQFFLLVSEEEKRVHVPVPAKMGSHSSALPLIFMCVVLMYFKRGKVEEEAGGGNGGLVMEDSRRGFGRGGGQQLPSRKKKIWFQKVDALKEHLDANHQKIPKQREGWLGKFWHNTEYRMKKGKLSSIQLKKLQSIGVPVTN